MQRQVNAKKPTSNSRNASQGSYEGSMTTRVEHRAMVGSAYPGVRPELVCIVYHGMANKAHGHDSVLWSDGDDGEGLWFYVHETIAGGPSALARG